MPNFFDIVKVKGPPIQMGRDYGRQTRDKMRELVTNSKDFYRKIGYDQQQIATIRERHEEGIATQSPDILEEIKGMADGAGIQYESLLDATLRGEIMDSLTPETECTTLVASARATADRNPVMGHNWDTTTDQRNIVVTIAKPCEGHSFITIGPVGRPGCEGINDQGLSIVMSGIVQRKRGEFLDRRNAMNAPSSWTHHIFLRCKNVDEALVECKKFQPAIHGENWVVGDGRNFANVEIAFAQMNIVRLNPESSDGKDLVTSTTNHYASAEMSCWGPNSDAEIPESPFAWSYDRKKRMTELLQSNIGKINLELAKSFLQDHEGAHPICRHKDERSYSTVSSEIMEPMKKRMWIAMGPSCRGEYQPFTL